ncbi:MAG: M28 family peptidase, partial [Anaerolineae bacterium]
SGVAVLLELARVYDPAKSKYEVVLAFFDGEDKGGIDGWPFSVGADIVAGRLAAGLSKMILVDMVGDGDLQIYLEGNSDPQLAAEIWDVAHRLGLGDRFVPQVRYTLMDDHVPFLRRGVPSVDVIDFDYPYWHTTADTADKVSAKSLEIVGRVLLEYLYSR